MIELVHIGIVGSLLGCLMVAKGKPLSANLLWLVTNPIICYHNYCIGDYSQMGLWTIYIILAIYGSINLWGKNAK